MLLQAMDNHHPGVQARATGCLAELLFYIASQSAAKRTGVWKLSSQSTIGIVEKLRNEIDPVVMHYAVRSIENLAVKRSLPWVQDLATQVRK